MQKYYWHGLADAIVSIKKIHLILLWLENYFIEHKFSYQAVWIKNKWGTRFRLIGTSSGAIWNSFLLKHVVIEHNPRGEHLEDILSYFIIELVLSPLNRFKCQTFDFVCKGGFDCPLSINYFKVINFLLCWSYLLYDAACPYGSLGFRRELGKSLGESESEAHECPTHLLSEHN